MLNDPIIVYEDLLQITQKQYQAVLLEIKHYKEQVKHSRSDLVDALTWRQYRQFMVDRQNEIARLEAVIDSNAALHKRSLAEKCLRQTLLLQELFATSIQLENELARIESHLYKLRRTA